MKNEYSPSEPMCVSSLPVNPSQKSNTNMKQNKYCNTIKNSNTIKH